MSAEKISNSFSTASGENMVAEETKSDILELINIYCVVHKENLVLQSKLGLLDKYELRIKLQTLDSNNTVLTSSLAQIEYNESSTLEKSNQLATIEEEHTATTIALAVESPRLDTECDKVSNEQPDEIAPYAPSSPFDNFLTSSPLQSSFNSMRKSGKFSIRGRLSLDLLNIRSDIGASSDSYIGDEISRRRRSMVRFKSGIDEEDPTFVPLPTLSSLSPSSLSDPTMMDPINATAAPPPDFLEFYSISLDQSVLSGQSKFERNRCQYVSNIGFVYPLPTNGQTPIVETIGDFCFPNGLGIEVRNEYELLIPSEKYFFEKKNSFHVMQFSDAVGNPTYGTCLTYYDKVNLSEPSAFVDNVNVWRKESFYADVIKCFLLRVICQNKGSSRTVSKESKSTKDSKDPPKAWGRSRFSRKRMSSSHEQERGRTSNSDDAKSRSMYSMLKNSLWRRRTSRQSIIDPKDLLRRGQSDGNASDTILSGPAQDANLLKRFASAGDVGRADDARKPVVEYVFIPRAICMLTPQAIHSLVIPILENVRHFESTTNKANKACAYTVNATTVQFLDQCFHFKLPDLFSARPSINCRRVVQSKVEDELSFPLFVTLSTNSSMGGQKYFDFQTDFVHFKDWTIGLLFAMLPAVDVVKLLNVLLLEGSVVVCGANVGVVSTISSALSYLINPFHWEGVFIPLIPPNALEILDSPVPFIVGTTHVVSTAQAEHRGSLTAIGLSPTAAVLYVDDYGSEEESMPDVSSNFFNGGSFKYRTRRSTHDNASSPSSGRRYLVLPSDMKVHDVDIEVCQQIEYICNHYRLKSLYQRIQVVEEISAIAKEKIHHLLDDLTVTDKRPSLFDTLDEPNQPKKMRESLSLRKRSTSSSNSHQTALWHADEVVLSSGSNCSSNNRHMQIRHRKPSLSAVTEELEAYAEYVKEQEIASGLVKPPTHTPSYAIEEDISDATRRPITQPFSLSTFLEAMRGTPTISTVPEDSDALAAPGQTIEGIHRLREVILRYNFSLTGEFCLHSHNWKKFGSYQMASSRDHTQRYHFFPQWLLEPLKDKLEFQRKMIGTQLFSSFVHAVQDEYFANERYRIFLADWIYFRWFLRSGSSGFGGDTEQASIRYFVDV